MGWVSWEQVRGRWRKFRDIAEEPEPQRIPEPLQVAHVNAAWTRSTASLLTPGEEEARRQLAVAVAEEQRAAIRQRQKSMLCDCWPYCVRSGEVVIDEGGPVILGRRDPRTGRPLELEEAK